MQLSLLLCYIVVMSEKRLQVAASIFAANPLKLGEEISKVSHVVDKIHFDVADNHYVPNLGLSPYVGEAIKREFSNLILDVHLMTVPTEAIIDKFSFADSLCFHLDACVDARKCIASLKAKQIKAGLAVKLQDNLDTLLDYLPSLHYLLFMGVEPGFSGQNFDPKVIEKIQQFKSLLGARQLENTLEIWVDGGVGFAQAAKLKQIGVDGVIAGSSIFADKNYAKAIRALW